jgi:CcmD family protein
MVKRVLVTVWSMLLLAWPALAQQPSAGLGEFRPVGPGAVVEQLPAAPYLIAAYAFVWIALMVYLWSIWRRLGKVEADMHTLEQRRTQQSRPR